MFPAGFHIDKANIKSCCLLIGITNQFLLSPKMAVEFLAEFIDNLPYSVLQDICDMYASQYGLKALSKISSYKTEICLV